MPHASVGGTGRALEAAFASCIGEGVELLSQFESPGDITASASIAAQRSAIGEDFDASTGGLEWSVNAYLLAFAAPLIALGRLADIVGRRRIVLLGTGLFAAASAVCGLAQSIEMLIAARVVQGIGASMLYSTSLSIVRQPTWRTSGFAGSTRVRPKSFASSCMNASSSGGVCASARGHSAGV